MDKGTHVEVVEGPKDVGVTGTVFWSGPDKYNEGQTRLGIRGDDGKTYWVDADHVEESERVMEAPDPGEAPEVSRGDRVRWDDGEGEVFWAGPSKFDDSTRLGIEDEHGEKHWLDARAVTIVSKGEGGGASSPPPRRDAPPPPEEYAPSSGSGDEVPPWVADADDPGPGDEDYMPASDSDSDAEGRETPPFEYDEPPF